jgi:Na+/H+ antiporter NhaA
LTAAAALAGTGLTMALFVTDLVFNLSGRWPNADGSAGGGAAAEG